MRLYNWQKIAFLSIILAFSANIVVAESLSDVMKSRGLTQKDVLAAAETYVPTGKRDDYIVFSSGGQSGQVIVYGIPSMRLLKYIGVFTPEPWQGYGYDDESKEILAQGRIHGKDITFGDTHHPALSETNGDYDGKYLFINDKANPRIAVIDLHDFETKQIVVNPVFKSSHGGTFVSENTDYIIEAAQYPAPFENEYVPLEQFNERYRGGMTYWPFDRKKGRIVAEEAFTVMAPPYSQDLSDFGKGPSDGWTFTNSFCTERYVGGIELGRPPFEAGCSAKDTDFMHVVNWRKAAELVKAGKATKINGHDVLTIDTAVKEGILYLIPEPKSPHGVDVSPDGKYIVVSGKLDSHTSVYSFEKILAAIKNKRFEGKDPYGIPIISMQSVLHKQVQLGLGPLHSQYDSTPCVIYTSLYVDSMVAKWNYCTGKVLNKISIHYNIGHLMTMHGDTKHPEGKYLVALNKLAIDRFNPVGPLHPQNHQLIDISGNKMELLFDMPLPLGEPHYAVAINAKLLKPAVRYKSGWNSRTNKRSPYKTRAGREKTVRTAGKVEVFGTTIRSHITPEIIEVDEGDEVVIHLTNLERAEDETHGFALYGHNINLSLEPGKTSSFSFTADKAGVYPYYCTEFCSALHLEMEGYLLVKPKGFEDVATKAQAGATYTEADYDKQVKENIATQAVIDQVVGFITSHNYQDFPPVVDLVEDATDQLGFAKEAKKKSEVAAEKKDWLNAALWANQWWQYQVKAADIGLRAKTYLEQHGAKQIAQVPVAKPVVSYAEIEQANLAQLATLNKEIGVILGQNYYNFPVVATLVADALKQLNMAKNAENNAKAAADVENAIKWQQAQNKAGEFISKAKAALELAGGEKVVGVPKKVVQKPVPKPVKIAPKKADSYGATLYKDKGCGSCHGADAKTPVADYPKLAGQNQSYLLAQMKDLSSGVRNNAKAMMMTGILAALTDAEQEIIAEWIASLDAGVKYDIDMNSEGAKLYQSKTCMACHGADANTPIMPNYPKLAEQNPAYVISQMSDIKSGARHNGQSAAMKGVMQGVTAEDIASIAEWLGSFADPVSVPVSVPVSAPVSAPVLVTEQVVFVDGETLYKDKGCGSCHGADGKTPIGEYPKLAGQNENYLLSQMKDLRSGNRNNAKSMMMKDILGALSDPEMEVIAKWIASLETKYDVDMETEGAKLYQSKTCMACHGMDANTPIMPNYPKLAEQNQAYAITQMTDIKSGARHNGQSAAMKGIMQGVTEAEIASIAEWLGSLKGELVVKAPSKFVKKVIVKKTAPVMTIVTTQKSESKNLHVDGATLYKEKGCESCHGANGKTAIGDYPKLAGQNENYLLSQMKDLRSGVRENANAMMMKGIMGELSDAELEVLAKWIATLEVGVKYDIDMNSKGAKLYKSKTCMACHGNDANTPIMPNYPKLAEQNPAYVITQMSDIKSGARHNGQSAAMKGVMQGVSAEDIASIADWLGSFAVVKTAVPVSVPVSAPVSAPVLVTEQVVFVDGETLYKDKGCGSCHGADAKALIGEYPKLAGQNENYLLSQMKDLRSGDRNNAKSMMMTDILAALSDPEMEVIAKWIASLETKYDVDMESEGAKLYKSKTCIACHGADANTPIMPNYPKLAEQNKLYAITQLTDIKSGARHNGQSAAMKGVMQGVTAEEIASIAEWLASFKGELVVKAPSKFVKKVVVKKAAPVVMTVVRTQKSESKNLNLDGATLYKEKGCESCHGADAKTPAGDYPKLAGQNENYLLSQMKDLRSGVRANAKSMMMKDILAALSDAEMEVLAKWIATLEASVKFNVDMDSNGAKLYKSKTCMACHGADANTPIMPNYPKLAKQNPAYVISQMTDIKSGARHNGQTAAMKGIMQGVTAEEIASIAEWLGSLQEKEQKVEVEKVVPIAAPAAVVTKPVSKGDGAMLYTQKGCIACHGVDGKMPIMPNYPKIAGLPQAYAVAMMKDIKSGARHNGQTMVMKGLMSSVSDADMTSIAEWLATLAGGAGVEGDPTLMAKGKALYKSKTCIACHGADAKKPVLPTYPKLAGQNKQYAIVQISDIKTGARDNGQTAAMKGVMHLVSQQEIGAIAEWLASLDGDSSVPVVEKKPELAVVTTKTTSHGSSSVGTWNQSGGEKDEAMHLTPNLENGLEVFEVCSACHLPEGWGKKEGTFPQLAGQHRTVLIKQLADIRAKNRDNPTMYPFALPSEIGGPQALADVTGYIAKLPMNPDNGLGAGDDLELGQQLFKDNCVKCHGKKGEGKPEKFYPRIQGQHYKYMLRQFKWIRDGKRRNANPDMVKQIHGFTDRDMKAVIDYVSRVKPPKEDLGEPGWLNPDFD